MPVGAMRSAPVGTQDPDVPVGVSIGAPVGAPVAVPVAVPAALPVGVLIWGCQW